MRHCVECRLGGEAEDVVVERTSIDALTGHLDESGHPIIDEVLTAFVEFGVGAAEALRRLLGNIDPTDQCAEKHAANDPVRLPGFEQRHYREFFTARRMSSLRAGWLSAPTTVSASMVSIGWTY
jgi:hypothetical protein